MLLVMVSFCLLLVDWFVFVCGTEAPPLLGTMAALLPHPPDWGAMASLLKPISQALSARYFFSPGLKKSSTDAAPRDCAGVSSTPSIREGRQHRRHTARAKKEGA